MSVREVSVRDADRLRGEGWCLVDVRSPGEFSAEHANSAINIPLDKLKSKEIREQLKSRGRLLMICQSGGRSRRACEALLTENGLELASVQGGTTAWVAENLPTVKGKGVISIERQVRIAAGLLVLMGVVSGYYLSSGFLLLSAFVGAGLIFAGITDFCGMGLLLLKMPWNQKPFSDGESCRV